MARTPLADRPLLAQWLIRARESRDYTAETFLADLLAEAGSAPNISNYRQWESGAVTPKEASLASVLAFWAARGIAGPAEAKPELSLEERTVRAAERQADAAEEANRLQAEQNDLLRLMLLRDQLPDDRWDEMRERGRAWTDAAVARLLTPPTHDHEPAQVG